jgi:hypothetical protein
MSTASIDRLILEVPAMPAAEGRRLGLLVVAGLARADRSSGSTADIPAVKVAVEQKPGDGLETLADRIVAETLRQIRRSS